MRLVLAVLLVFAVCRGEAQAQPEAGPQPPQPAARRQLGELEVVWRYAAPRGLETEPIAGFAVHPDGGFIVVVVAGWVEYRILRFDAQWTLQWDRTVTIPDRRGTAEHLNARILVRDDGTIAISISTAVVLLSADGWLRAFGSAAGAGLRSFGTMIASGQNLIVGGFGFVSGDDDLRCWRWTAMAVSYDRSFLAQRWTAQLPVTRPPGAPPLAGVPRAALPLMAFDDGGALLLAANEDFGTHSFGRTGLSQSIRGEFRSELCRQSDEQELAEVDRHGRVTRRSRVTPEALARLRARFPGLPPYVVVDPPWDAQVGVNGSTSTLLWLGPEGPALMRLVRDDLRLRPDWPPWNRHSWGGPGRPVIPIIPVVAASTVGGVHLVLVRHIPAWNGSAVAATEAYDHSLIAIGSAGVRVEQQVRSAAIRAMRAMRLVPERNAVYAVLDHAIVRLPLRRTP